MVKDEVILEARRLQMKFVRQYDGIIYQYDEENKLWFSENSIATYKRWEDIPNVVKMGETAEDILLGTGETKYPDLVREEVEEKPMSGNWIPKTVEFKRGAPYARRTEIYVHHNHNYHLTFIKEDGVDEFKRVYVTR